MALDWLDIAKRLQSIAQAGLEFGYADYDHERYQMIRDISVEIMQNHTDAPTEKIVDLFASGTGYLTPKVDVRCAVFRNGKILMVKERVDERWTLPGGWAEVSLTPFENAEKEVWEEAGLKVKATRLLGVIDKSKHNHPPEAHHIYRLFILCKDLGGEIKPGMETLDVKWTEKGERLDLSPPRSTQKQINTMFEYYENPDKEVMCD